MKKRFICIYIFVIFTLLNTTAYASGLENVDIAGNNILQVIYKFGFWILLILSGKEVITKAVNGDVKSSGRAIIKYVMAYGSLYFLPWAFTMVENIF